MTRMPGDKETRTGSDGSFGHDKKKERKTRAGSFAERRAAVILAALITVMAVPGAASPRPAAAVSSLPDRYETAAKTPVYDQKDQPLCWAYSSVDMLNISAVKQGFAAPGTSAYSAPAFARAIYTGREYRNVQTPSMWYRYSANVGQSLMAAASGKGLLSGSEYPTLTSVNSIGSDGIYNISGIVSEFRTFDIWEEPDKKLGKIKEWVYGFGSVSVSVFLGDYDRSTGEVLTKNWDYSAVSHSVLIVGWDDSKITASGSRGAFLIKNSWGSSWGNGGYAYMSYGAAFGREIYAAKAEPAAGKKVLTNAEILPQGANVSGEKRSAVNLFRADEDMTVTHGKVYISTPGTVTVNVWKNVSSVSAGLVSTTPDATATLNVSEPGYYSLKLNRTVSVTAGNYIAAEFISRRSDGCYVTYGDYLDMEPPEWNTTSGKGKCYLITGTTVYASEYNYIGALLASVSSPATAVPKPTEVITATPSVTQTPRVDPTAPQDEITPSAAASASGDPGSTASPAASATADQSDVIALPTDAPDNATPDPGEAGPFSGIIGKIKTAAGLIALAASGLVILAVVLGRSGSKEDKKKG